MMLTCADLLDAVNTSKYGYSDYRMTQILGLDKSEMSKYRHEKRFPSVTIICQLSEWAGQDPAKWVFAIEARRMRKLKTATAAAPLERLAGNYS